MTAPDPSHSSEVVPGRVHALVTEGVGWIVLDNPRKHNAMSLAMWEQLRTLLDDFGRDAAIRCVVLRGAGDKAFCAGADIGEKQGRDADQSVADRARTLAGLRAVEDFPKPVLAMVAGYCLGGGLALALACDLRIAATGAVFGIPAARLGLAYHYGAVKRLTELVGPACAKQIIFTADRFSAERAQALGLANEVAAAEQLEAFVAAMAERIACNAPLTIAAAKQAVTVVLSETPEQGMAASEALATASLASEDYAEGRLAFKEKRPPVFRGR